MEERAINKTHIDEKTGRRVFNDNPNSYFYRWVAQKKYGYSSQEMKQYDVHHIDGDKLNDSNENLVILRPDDHMQIETQMRVSKNRSIILLFLCAFALLFNGYMIIYPTHRTLIFLLDTGCLSLAIYLALLPYEQLRKVLFKVRILKPNKK